MASIYWAVYVEYMLSSLAVRSSALSLLMRLAGCPRAVRLSTARIPDAYSNYGAGPVVSKSYLANFATSGTTWQAGRRVGSPDGKRISQMLAIRPHIPARRGAHTECTHLGHLQALRIQQTCKLRYGPVCPSGDCPACGVRPSVRRVPQRLRSIVIIPPQFCRCSADFCQCPHILCQAPAGFHPRFHPLPPLSTPFHPVRCQSSAIFLPFSRHAAPYCGHTSCAIPPHSSPFCHLPAFCLPLFVLVKKALRGRLMNSNEAPSAVGTAAESLI